MKRILQLLTKGKQLYLTDSLFRNAALLMASTAIMSVLGFVFWIFVAHLYSPAMIGEASALISITTLVSNVSLLGLNAGLIRFLPHSKDQSRDINASLITVAIATIIAASVYLLVSTLFDVHIALLETPFHQIAFVVLMTTVSLNSLTDAVFIANRRAEFHTIGYATFGIVKLILPLFLIPFGSLGIFLAYILAVIASLILSLYFMKRFCGYTVGARPNWNLLKKTRKYATNNYIGVILAGLPSQLMPLFIIKELGAAQVAYFSMAWTMVNLIYVVPSAAAQSLLAESSHDTSQKNKHLKHTVRLLSMTLIPGVLLAVLVAPYVLQIFGKQYSVGSTTIFQLLAIATFFVAINAICNAVLNIERRTSGIVIAQIGSVVATFASAIFLGKYGLTGIGEAMLFGTIVSNICLYFIFRYNRKHPVEQSDDSASSEFNVTHDNLALMLGAYGVKEFKFHQLHNGSSSYTFLIKVREKVVVLRIYKKGKKDDAQIKNEFTFINFLSARGINVPHVIKNLKGEIVSRTMIDKTSWQYILMPYESGQHPKTYTTSLIQNMAKIQAKVHKLGLDYASQQKEQKSEPKRKGMLSLLLHPAPKGFSHFDFDASNILVDGDTITCILDFEGMRYDPLIVCVFFTLTRIYDSQTSLKDLQLYLGQYQNIRPLNIFEKTILSFALVLRYKSPKLFLIHSY